MNREEIVSLRQRLLDRQLQPIAVFNWDHPGIPEKHRGKRPSELNWQNTIGMPVYRDVAQNTGVLTGKVYPLDIDIEDPVIVAEIVTMAEKLFGRTSVRCRSNSPRRLLPYRIEGGEARKVVVPLSCGKLEFLGRGQHFTGFGKHFSGVDYEWQGRSLDETEIDELPVIDAAVISAFKTWAEARWPVAEKPNGDGRKSGGKADFRNTCLVEDVEAALKALPCDYDYGTWVKLGMAYRAGGGSYEVFLEWSRQHRDYQSDEWIDEKWKSFANAHSVTVKTLFKEVFDRVEGWKKPSEREPAHDTDPAGDDWDSEPDDEAQNSVFEEKPLPLFPEPETLAPYPVEALGPLRAPTEAIATAAVVATALAAQSVLAVASLATMALADIQFPTGDIRPLSLYLITIAVSGERKTSSDEKALLGIEMRSDELRQKRELKARSFGAALAAHNSEFQLIKTNRKITLQQRQEQLEKLGPAPKLPPLPVFISHDQTVEGLLKHWSNIQPNHGLFTSEGGVLVEGAAMSHDLKMRTAGVWSSLWGKGNFTKLRAGDDNPLELRGKRLALHLMLQPNFVGSFLNDPGLRGQGLLSRPLVTWPPSKIGERPFRLPEEAVEAAITAFGRKICELLRRVSINAENELNLRVLAIEPDSEAFRIWRNYHDEIDPQLKAEARHGDQADIGSKSAEQAGRIAGILTIVADPNAPRVPAAAMRGGVTLAHWYLEEARRLRAHSASNPKLGDAERLLKWLQTHPKARTTREVGRLVVPERLRPLETARPLLGILAEYGWIVWQNKRQTQFAVWEESDETDDF